MKKFMYFAAALLVLVGCNKNSQTNKENAPQEIVTIKGGIVLPKTPNKIAAPEGWESEEGEFGMRWEENDQIYIYNGAGESSLFTIASGAGDSEASFNGSPLSSMEGYNVAYGYDPTSTSTEYTVSYIEGNYRPFAEGEGVNYDFTIDNFGPVIGLQLKGDGAFSKIEVVLSNSSKETLATYTMTFAEALTLSAESVTKVYFPIQAKEGAVKIAISFYKKVNSEEVLTLTKTTNMPEANKVTTFPVLTFKSAYEYVDLGLPSGLKWATCNVGATTPEGYGDYFAWGKTAPHQDNDYSEGKYTYKDNPTTLPLDHDAANVNWGGNWRMPTKAELDELETNCAWSWTQKNGINGYEVEGPNKNTIFLPASGYRYDSSLDCVGSHGYYWSSSIDEGFSGNAYYLYFFGDDVPRNDSFLRYNGRSVRPVYKIVYK